MTRWWAQIGRIVKLLNGGTVLTFHASTLQLLRMITFLHGRLAHALPTQATIDVGGVGYEVFIPLSSYDKLPAVGQPIEILTHLHVREDAQILYGFMTKPERDLFRLLVNHVSGIGPKLALAVLSAPARPVQREKSAAAGG